MKLRSREGPQQRSCVKMTAKEENLIYETGSRESNRDEGRFTQLIPKDRVKSRHRIAFESRGSILPVTSATYEQLASQSPSKHPGEKPQGKGSNKEPQESTTSLYTADGTHISREYNTSRQGRVRSSLIFENLVTMYYYYPYSITISTAEPTGNTKI